jgi:hypothetical protein
MSALPVQADIARVIGMSFTGRPLLAVQSGSLHGPTYQSRIETDNRVHGTI